MPPFAMTWQLEFPVDTSPYPSEIARSMEAKEISTSSPVSGTGRRKRRDPAEDLLTHLTHDAGGVMKLLAFAVASFLSFFGACMATFVSIQPGPRYLWLGFCLVTAAISVVIMIRALSAPAVEE